MHVVFIEPRFPANQKQFIRALAEIGATISAIGEGSKASLDDDLKRWLTHYEEVTNVCDEQQVLAKVRFIQRHAHVDRLEASVEAHILPTAHVREAAGIPGTSARTAFLCRDKPAMKEVLRAGGVPCAQSTAAGSLAEVRAFAEQVGYPILVKPRDGAGASGAARVDSDRELEAAAAALHLQHGRSIAVEEFIEGHEGFYDTMSVNGVPVMEFVSHYYPNVLDAMRNRWISPYIVSTNRLDASGYDALKDLGRKVITTMGLGTTATHMEWFYGPKGLKFSEIGARPPGVGQWDVYAAGNDIDIYREWANAIVHGRIERRPSRRFASGIIALRPDRDGRIVGYEGVEEVQRRFGEFVTKAHLPPAGTPTQGIEAGYMANAWIQMRHPDYDTMREIFEVIGRTVRVRAG